MIYAGELGNAYFYRYDLPMLEGVMPTDVILKALRSGCDVRLVPSISRSPWCRLSTSERAGGQR